MDELDLDAFIANIEQSAPKEEIGESQHQCQECNAILEEVEGEFICPNCSAQATDILQLEDTELHYNEAGVAIMGARVSLTERKNSKYTTEYGWAWSTDEAVVHILKLQLDAMEQIGLVPDYFRQAIKNMWLKFWVDNIAPYIKDEYTEEELVQISVDKALKLRDIEVLVRIQDKVMIPKRALHGQYRQKWKMMGADFYRDRVQSPKVPEPIACDEEWDGDSSDNSQSPHILRDASQQRLTPCPTRNRGLQCISILTLNRTLAFIEAAARCLELDEPIFASDITRACSQRLIPFFGAHKTLPEGMKFNFTDRLTFQKNRAPMPIELTRAACFLLHKLYSDKFPLMVPIPDLKTILRRFLVDMNLPLNLMEKFKAPKLDFSCFKTTRSYKLGNHKGPRGGMVYFPQYDRWAFAILMFHLKRLFVLDKQSIDDQRQSAAEDSHNAFVLYDWVCQMSMRLHLIMNYDPYMIFHPMGSMTDLQVTPQLYNYIETLLGDRIIATTRTKRLMTDDDFRSEMTEFLKRELPRPPHLDEELPDEKFLEKPIHLRHPIQDAFARTQRFWINELKNDQGTIDLLFRDFSNMNVLTLENDRTWTIFDEGAPVNLKKFNISPNWPYCFKLLLSIGGYICYCEPEELLDQYRKVEQYMYPHTKVLLKNRRNSGDQ